MKNFKILLLLSFFFIFNCAAQSNFQFWKMANNKSKSGDYRGAVAIMNNAIRKDPKYAPHYFKRADYKYKLEDFVNK